VIKLPIICTGGIGDCLLTLGRIPIHFLGILGFRFQLFYKDKEHPARKILTPFFKNIKYVHYAQGSPSDGQLRVFQKMMSLSQYYKIIWRVPIREHAPINRSKKSSKTILIQTHLDGAPAKIWNIANWISLISKLNGLGYDVSIMEWDADSRAKIIDQCPFVNDVGDGNLMDLCIGISRFDLVVSIDSWTKYPAEWYKIKQIVVVPNLNNGYPNFATITADWIARWWFHGLMNNLRVKILGLELFENKYEYTLPSLDTLSVDALLLEIQKLLPIH
jgi:ADP-heptose:LPS heptosyltransferase